MTVIAGIAARNVCRVLTCCRYTVVAGTACAHDVCVVDRENRYKHVCVVAILADIGGLNVCRILSGRIHSIVAIDAIAGDVDVIKIRGQPCDRRMTVVTVIPTANVRRRLTRRDRAIVAVTAASDYLRVIDRIHGHEQVRVVAVLAHVGRLYVRRALADRICAVMAVDAVVGDVRVVENRR